MYRSGQVAAMVAACTHVRTLPAECWLCMTHSPHHRVQVTYQGRKYVALVKYLVRLRRPHDACDGGNDGEAEWCRFALCDLYRWRPEVGNHDIGQLLHAQEDRADPSYTWIHRDYAVLLDNIDCKLVHLCRPACVAGRPNCQDMFFSPYSISSGL